MNVKGVAFLARQTLVTREHGPDVWASFLSVLQEREPFFRTPVTALAQVPVQTFLHALDLLAERLYPRQTDIWWHIGINAAKEAMSEGWLEGAFEPGELRRFLSYTPRIYENYFDFGELKVTDAGADTVELSLSGTPVHPYFEGAVIGFCRGGLEVLGARHPVPDRVRGFGRGDRELVYRFKLG